MGKVLIINKSYKIRNGVLSGKIGLLVAYDAIENKAVLKFDKYVKVVTISENLELI